MRKLGGGFKGREWWSEEVTQVIMEKTETYHKYMKGKEKRLWKELRRKTEEVRFVKPKRQMMRCRRESIQKV